MPSRWLLTQRLGNGGPKQCADCAKEAKNAEDAERTSVAFLARRVVPFRKATRLVAVARILMRHRKLQSRMQVFRPQRASRCIAPAIDNSVNEYRSPSNRDIGGSRRRCTELFVEMSIFCVRFDEGSYH